MAQSARRPVESEPGILRGAVRPDLIRDESLSEIFAATVAARPDHPALVSEGARLTYREVDRASDGIARGLVRLGIGPGDVVGLWMERGPDLLVAQIAITKTGAAWLPFDADAPADRIAVCLQDADAKGLLTSEGLSARAPRGKPVLTAPQLIDPADARPIDPRGRGLTPAHPAYMIYTSGSTGVPKGIVVTQGNICHFLRSANDLYGLRAEDVVFQGASVAFDLSMEEIWIPLMVGATLFVATPAMIGDVERLPDLLRRAGVTVLDTVPTLLGMLSRPVPSLRLILLGGEALPAPLVQRWATPSCRLLNTYGPTEATVVATACEVRPGEAVTIGRPIPNYSCYVVDEAGRICGTGQQGELWIGGPGVAAGYLKRPELTAEKFVANPFTGAEAPDPVLYRSGDAVSLTPDGDLAFHGRIDDQVKIRGFRVELGEIETRVGMLPGVSQAAVVLRQDEGLDRLVAFVVADAGAEVVPAGFRTALRRDLPAYMVPDHFEAVPVLPRLSSGKVDRHALRAVPVAFGDDGGGQEVPANETEAALLVSAKRALGDRTIPFEADFFTDLGGHSLLAARFVSAVREVPALASITLQDVYANRTLRAIGAALLARTGGSGSAPPRRDLSFSPPPLRRRILCGLAQAMVLPFILTFTSAQWLGVFVTFLVITGEGLTVWGEIAFVLGVYAAINVVTAVTAIAVKWLVLGRTRPGRYPLWGSYYFRWWVAGHFVALINTHWLRGSPALSLFLRLLGAKVGRDVNISHLDVGAYDLLTIGDGTTIGGNVGIANAELTADELIIEPVEIGADVLVGTGCVIGGGAVLGDHAELLDLTAIAPGTRVAAWERWDGSPGRRAGRVDPATLPQPAEASPLRRATLGVLYGLCLLAVPSIALLPIFPAFYFFDRIDDFLSAVTDIDLHWFLPLVTWPIAMVMIVVTVLLLVLVRWTLLPRNSLGTYSVFGFYHFRRWALALASEVMLETLNSLFSTLYIRGWYRLLGIPIARGSEIASDLSGRYGVAIVGEKNFLADDVAFGEEDIRRGWMQIRPVVTGARVFVGNDAVVPPGAIIPDDVLIGVKSKPPANDRMAPGDVWFGSPPIKLPTRQIVQGDAYLTFEPTLRRKVARALFEAVCISFSPMLVIVMGFLTADFIFYPIIQRGEWGRLAVAFSVAGVLLAILQTFIAAAIKWLAMGTYRPTMKPMWSWWALRTEAVTLLYWGLGRRILIEQLSGTPFLPWILRLFGCSIGKGVCLHTADITEFDCVSIGDYAVVNGGVTLQTHLFEDRIMKVGTIELGRGASVAGGTTILYDTRVGDFARIGFLTLVMKGESIPAHSEWEGSPSVPVVRAEPQRLAA